MLESSAVALGDLNRDGMLDVVSAYKKRAQEGVSQVGYGDGTFEPPSFRTRWFLSGSLVPRTILLADFNRDGWIDALVENEGFSILLGNHNGRLGTGESLPTGARYIAPASTYPVSSFAVGDWTGDGLPDVARSDQGLGKVQVWVNAGDGSFPRRLDFTLPSPVDLAAADVTGDHILDLLAPASAGGISVLRGYGDGDFVAAAPIATPPAREIEAGDLNGDGIPDLAVLLATAGTEGIAILLGKPMGGVDTPIILTTPTELRSLQLFDIDGDEALDLVATAGGVSGPGRVAVFRGDGAGGFATVELSGFGVGSGPIAIGRIDGDAFADIAAASPDGVTILQGRSGGLFGDDSDIQHPPGAVSARLGDLDEDGFNDVLLDLNGTSSAYVLRGLAGGTFASAVTLDLGGDLAPDVIVDVDSDGMLDLIESGHSGVAFARGRAGLVFDPPVSLSSLSSVVSADAADANGDGKLDIIAWFQSSSYSPSSFVVWPGAGDGTFGAGISAYQAGSSVRSIALGDLNGDGRSDLLINVGFSIASRFYVSFGQPNGTFLGSVESRVGHPSSAVRLADLDRDGKLDLVSIGGMSEDMLLIPMLGDGAGGFSGLDLRYYNGDEPVWTQYRTGPNATSLEVADLDGDKIPDVVVPIGDGHVVSVRLGEGDGSLGGREYGTGPAYKVTAASREVLIGDLNRDGAPEILALHPETQSFTPLWNTGCGEPPIEWAQSIVEPKNARIEWRASSPLEYAATVFRADESLAWTSLGAASVGPDGRAVFDDSSVQEGHSYTYRLRAQIGTCDSPAGEVNIVIPRARRFDFSSPDYPYSLAAADLDHDGRDDIVTADLSGRSLTLHHAQLDGSFASIQRVSLGSQPYAMQSADLNRDGVPDFVTGNPESITRDSSSLSIVLGQSDGSLGPATRLITEGYPLDLEIADFNRDSIPDLVAPSGVDRVSLFLGLGDGSFDRRRLVFTPETPWAFGSGDFDEDGIRDLAIGSIAYDASFVSINRGHGDGTFDTPTSLPSPHDFYDVLVADLDDDDHLDIGIPDYSQGNELWIYLGLGNGSFEPVVKIPIGEVAHSLRSIDMDLDGISDLVGIHGRTAQSVFVMKSHGGLVFDSAVELRANVSLTEVQPIRRNENATPDLVVGSSSGVVSIFVDPLDTSTPTQASLVSFESSADSVTLTWFVPGVINSRIHRRGHGDAIQWTDQGSPTRWVGDMATFVDRSVAPGATYSYRLRDPSTNQWLTNETSVTVPLSARLELRGTRPNPGRARDLVFELGLATHAPARLEVLDVMGRRMTAIGLSDPIPGMRTIRLPSDVQLRPGLYLARVLQGSVVATRRFVVIE